MSDQLSRRSGYNVQLLADDLNPGGNFTALGAIVDAIDHSGAKKDTFFSELLTDLWKRRGTAGIDPGEVTFMLALDPRANTTYTRCSNMLQISGFDLGTNFKIQYPVTGTDNSTHTEPFTAYVSGLGRQIKKAQQILAPVTLSIDGNPGLGNAA